MSAVVDIDVSGSTSVSSVETRRKAQKPPFDDAEEAKILLLDTFDLPDDGAPYALKLLDSYDDKNFLVLDASGVPR